MPTYILYKDEKNAYTLVEQGGEEDQSLRNSLSRFAGFSLENMLVVSVPEQPDSVKPNHTHTKKDTIMRALKDIKNILSGQVNKIDSALKEIK